MSTLDDSSSLEAQESLLYSARHGEVSVVKGLLDAKRENKLTLDINCKGLLQYLIKMFLSPILSFK